MSSLVIEKKIEGFIAEQGVWQQGVLRELRELILSVDPGVEENWRWGCPHFDHNGIMMGMMAFKKHINLFFHKGGLVNDPKGLFVDKDQDKGTRSVKITEADKLDKPGIRALVRNAIKVNQGGAKLNAAKKPRPPVLTPKDLAELLEQNEHAVEHWKKFSPSRRREYTEWITEAKRTATRERRLKQAIEMIARGEGRHDKYRNC